jgi:hypothetical protein
MSKLQSNTSRYCALHMAKRKKRQKRDGHSSEWGKGTSANKADINPPTFLLHGIPSGSGGGTYMSLHVINSNELGGKKKSISLLSSAFCLLQNFTQETSNREATVGVPSFFRSRKVPQLFKKRQKEPERRMIGARARNRDGWMSRRSSNTMSTCACTNS